MADKEEPKAMPERTETVDIPAEELGAGSSGSSKKRPLPEPASDEPIAPELLAKMSRSERKRHREKKRRSDVNKGFDELMSLLLEVDPEVRAEAEERAMRGQWKGNFGSQEENLLSRVDLITRTIAVLRRIHQENEERKRIIASLSLGGPRTTPSLGVARQLSAYGSDHNVSGSYVVPNCTTDTFFL